MCQQWQLYQDRGADGCGAVCQQWQLQQEALTLWRCVSAVAVITRDADGVALCVSSGSNYASIDEPVNNGSNFQHLGV